MWHLLLGGNRACSSGGCGRGCDVCIQRVAVLYFGGSWWAKTHLKE